MSAGTLSLSAGIGRGYLGFGLRMSTRASSTVVAASVAGLAVVTLLRWATQLREEDGVVCSPLSELILRWRLRRLEAAPPSVPSDPTPARACPSTDSVSARTAAWIAWSSSQTLTARSRPPLSTLRRASPAARATGSSSRAACSPPRTAPRRSRSSTSTTRSSSPPRSPGRRSCPSCRSGTGRRTPW